LETSSCKVPPQCCEEKSKAHDRDRYLVHKPVLESFP
jgi:hypothetical protein